MHYKCLNKHVPPYESSFEDQFIDLASKALTIAEYVLLTLDKFLAQQVRKDDVDGPYSVYTPYRRMLKNPEKSQGYAAQEFLNQLGNGNPQDALNNMATQSYAYCAKSVYAAKQALPFEAWMFACEAKYWLGMLRGATPITGIGNQMATIVPKVTGSKGGKAKSDRYEPLRELSKKLAATGNYPSKRNAAIAIAPRIVEESKRLKINMSANQILETLQRSWLTGMVFTRKR